MPQSNNGTSDVSMKTSETLSDTEKSEDMDISATDGETTAKESEASESGTKKREDVVDTMSKIEKEFAELKDSLFSNSIKWLEKDAQRISSGSHEKFIEGTEDLEIARDHKLWRIEQWRKYRMENIERMFEAEKQQAFDEYETEKERLQEKMLHSVQNKMTQLEEEKITLSNPEGTPTDSRATTRQLRKRAREKEPKQFARKLSPSQINYTLQDSDIAEDLNLISKNHPTDPNFDRERWLSLVPMEM